MPQHLEERRLHPVFLLALPMAVAAVVGLLLVRGMTYRGTVHWATTLPGWAQEAFLTVSEYGILLLIGLFGAAALVAWSRGTLHLARGVAAGVGVVLAYGTSETVKVLVTEVRPCHTFDVRALAACPGPGDWSWPSNHATIAVAVAVAVLLMSGRLGAAALPVAALIAVSRVVVGVHYPHDVLAGAVLGANFVVLCARWGAPAVGRLLASVEGRTVGRRAH